MSGKNNKQRYLLEEYAVGDEVSIERVEHGWLNGLGGVIIELSSDCAIVRTEQGDYEVTHCRDMSKC